MLWKEEPFKVRDNTKFIIISFMTRSGYKVSVQSSIWTIPFKYLFRYSFRWNILNKVDLAEFIPLCQSSNLKVFFGHGHVTIDMNPLPLPLTQVSEALWPHIEKSKANHSIIECHLQALRKHKFRKWVFPKFTKKSLVSILLLTIG